MPLSFFIMILVGIPALLFSLMLIQGVREIKRRNEAPLTVEEGLEAVIHRIKGRDYLQNVIVAGGAAALFITGMTVFYLLWTAQAVSYAGPLLIALCVAISSFLTSRWLKKTDALRVVAILESAYSKDLTRSESLSRLLRTYLYYAGTDHTHRPALFQWVRREISLFIQGLDLRAHFALSSEYILKNMAYLIVAVMLLTMILSFSCGGLFGISPLSNQSSPSREDGVAQTFTEESDNTSSTQEEESAEKPPSPDQDEQEAIPPEVVNRKSEGPNEQEESSGTEVASTGPEPGRSGGEIQDDEVMPTDTRPDRPSQQPENTETPPDETEDHSVFSQLMDGLKDLFGSSGDEESTPDDAMPAGTASSDDVAQGQTSGSGDNQALRPTKAPSGGPDHLDGSPVSDSTDPAQPASDGGAGNSGNPRISRGSGGDLFGEATAPQMMTPEDGAIMRLGLGQETAEDAAQTSRDIPRPQRYNALVELKPEDVSATPADPFLTQRIPKPYQRAIKRLLTKNE